MTLTCDRCGTTIEIGMYPFCKGNPTDHGATFSKSTIFPFEARHVAPDGKPMVINDLPHLRRVEREYGVVFHAFSKGNDRDISPAAPDAPRYRGDDADFKRDHK